jgi:hypothetical protein
LTYETAGVRGWPHYVWKTLAHSLRGPRFDLIVCGHIHLIPLAVAAATILDAQVVLVIHGIEAWQPSARTLVNRMLSRVTAVIAVSEHTRRRFLAWSGLPPEKVRLLPNAIQEKLFGAGLKDTALARRCGLTGRTVLLTLGRLAACEPPQTSRYLVSIARWCSPVYPNPWKGRAAQWHQLC